jgi:hypothetical protein
LVRLAQESWYFAPVVGTIAHATWSVEEALARRTAAMAMVGRGKEEEARRRGGKSTTQRASTLRRRRLGGGEDMKLGERREARGNGLCRPLWRGEGEGEGEWGGNKEV